MGRNAKNSLCFMRQDIWTAQSLIFSLTRGVGGGMVTSRTVCVIATCFSTEKKKKQGEGFPTQILAGKLILI